MALVHFEGKDQVREQISPVPELVRDEVDAEEHASSVYKAHCQSTSRHHRRPLNAGPLSSLGMRLVGVQ